MGFASPNTNLLNGQTVGEAPSLSSIYGEYDNGANIFTIYADFGGSTLSNAWSLQGSAIFVPGTGVETVNDSGALEGSIMYSGSMTNPNMIIEESTFYSGSADDQNTGFYSSGIPSGPGGLGGYGVSPGGGLSPVGYSATFSAYAGSANLYSNGTSLSYSGTYPSTSGYSFQQLAISSSNFNWSYVSGSTEYYAGNYDQLSTAISYQAGGSNSQGGHNPNIINSNGGIYFSSSTGMFASTQYIYWIRVRELPPNGVAPQVSGLSTSLPTESSTPTTSTTTLSQTPPTVSLYSPSLNGLAVTINGATLATTNGATVSSLNWNWGDGQETTGFFPQSHSYSLAGTYLITVTATDSNGLTKSASESVTVTISSFSGATPSSSKTTPTPSLVATPISSGTPSWAFNGAYAQFQTSYSFNGVSISDTVKYTVSNVNVNSQSLDLTVSYGGSASSFPSYTTSSSFTNPSPLAVSPSDLALLNVGKTPNDISGAQVTTGVSVNVPAGSFTTDEVKFPYSGTEWVEASSGLIVQTSGSIAAALIPGAAQSLQVQLQSTNIPTSGVSSSNVLLYAIIIIIVLVLAAVIGFLALKRRKSKRTRVESPQQKSQSTTAMDANAVQKLNKLKDMLDKGLITQEDYDKQKKMLLERM